MSWIIFYRPAGGANTDHCFRVLNEGLRGLTLANLYGRFWRILIAGLNSSHRCSLLLGTGRVLVDFIQYGLSLLFLDSVSMIISRWPLIQGTYWMFHHSASWWGAFLVLLLRALPPLIRFVGMDPDFSNRIVLHIFDTVFCCLIKYNWIRLPECSPQQWRFARRILLFIFAIISYFIRWLI